MKLGTDAMGGAIKKEKPERMRFSFLMQRWRKEGSGQQGRRQLGRWWERGEWRWWGMYPRREDVSKTASILIPYSDVHSINIQLHRAKFQYILLLSYFRIRAWVSACAWPGTVYKVDSSIIMFARLCLVIRSRFNSTRVATDLWSRNQIIFSFFPFFPSLSQFPL